MVIESYFQGSLVSVKDLTPGGLYVFRGLSRLDSLSIWSGDSTDTMSWRRIGDLQVGDIIFVISASEVRIASFSNFRFLTNIVWHGGVGFWSMDPRFIGSDESALFSAL